MKILKTAILTLSFLIFTSIFVKAERPTIAANKTVNYVLDKYIESTVLGNVTDFAELIDDNFKHYITYNEKTITYNKKQFIKQVNSSKNTILNCTTNYHLIENNQDTAIAKVEMKFPSFTKTNYVTMANSADGWKIINATTLYF